ncbi:MAG: NUDIX hydrolase [Patescibacteria group bacterium]
MKNHFQGNFVHPQHVSVGAVVVNEKKEICCHHLYAKDIKGYWKEEGLDDFYLLMRETIQPNDSLETSLNRGLQKEFGITATLRDYVGSIQGSFTHKDVPIQKTTLYFLCDLVQQDLSLRDTSDVEGQTQVEWQTADFLIPRMKAQAEKFGRTDIDESFILERVQKIL